MVSRHCTVIVSPDANALLVDPRAGSLFETAQPLLARVPSPPVPQGHLLFWRSSKRGVGKPISMCADAGTAQSKHAATARFRMRRAYTRRGAIVDTTSSARDDDRPMWRRL